ncbi:uncharacterized protein LOC143553584 [Bidens hawaiensis]|uniref:uncharacterized protein LOC143553584 n=1 Tax=Bidens hawaiensis TaxID=980011 RepID=UPI004049289E
MGSFDVIVGMDWLYLNLAEVVCFEKFLHIHLNDARTLNVFGDLPTLCSRLVVEKDYVKKKLQDIPVVHDFPDVFPDDVSVPPPIFQVEFHIDLVPRENLVAKAPYCLTSSELQELSNQLQELSDKGFIRPSSSPWDVP